ncbi:protein RRNAD1-like isoform X1 [Stegodyphus dumicola]|uniref:protein RRNAD1-like isoform X1 n=2 Tax=Stegodyphus dumicola TaxID=202533 RepID=UPI0015B16A16|nr:protein RRNAD1-like isoform X1 [Stegodyphus dumicola]
MNIKSEMVSSSMWNMDHETILKYLSEITELLAEYSWIYNVRNTDIFLHDVLEKIPSEWCESLIDLPWKDMNQLPFGFIKEDWPEMLKTFIRKCCDLGSFRFPKSNLQETTVQVKTFVNKTTPRKKQLEIKIMSILIDEICKNLHCNYVLDIGSGLGYLDQALHHNCGVKCIGLDSVPAYTEAAVSRLKDDPCNKALYHITLKVENSAVCLSEVRTALWNAYNKDLTCSCKISTCANGSFNKSHLNPVLMVGLHCCGNLMQDMMSIFSQMDELKAFVCVGCCYNKINITNFPVSNTAKFCVKAACKDSICWYPCISGLRLGSHATRSEWVSLSEEMLSYRERSLAFRAVLQYYIAKENKVWKKPKRRLRQSDFTDFQSYCNKMLDENFKEEETLEKLNMFYLQKQHLFPRIRILLVLQLLLQPLWEAFVTIDRMLFFRENSIFAECFALWDDKISPRNIVLCAYKI